MSFENFSTKKHSLYPERPSANLDADIEKLKNLEAGEIPKIELDAHERDGLLKFENALGQELEDTERPVILTYSFYIDYFMTPRGREDFKKTTGKKLAVETEKEVKYFILQNKESIRALTTKEQRDLSNRSRMFADEQLLQRLTSRVNNDGTLDTRGVKVPVKTDILSNPKAALEKMVRLRNFRRKIKTELEKSSLEGTSDLVKAKTIILSLYKRRVNQVLAEQFSCGASIAKMSELLTDHDFSEEEKTIKNLFFGLASVERNYSRYDKFSYGADAVYDLRGNRQQVSEEVKKYADSLESLFIKNELEKDSKIREFGLDAKKIFAPSIPPEEFSLLEEELLELYGQKSSYPPSEYEPDREGPAADDRWQFVTGPEYRSMGVDGKQKVIKSPIKNKSVFETMSILLGHETEGHMLQHLNKSKIPLRMFKELGGDRTSLFSEGGAMMVEDAISQKAFGLRTLPHGYYVKAMIAKLEGGNYLDCVKAFFESRQKVLFLKKENGQLMDADYEEEVKKNLRLAIDRTKRLFSTGMDYENISSHLTRSRDTVYLEQLILSEKLKKAGLEKYLFVANSNLKTLASLTELGLINLNEIEVPKLYSLKIWEKIRHNYALDKQGPA